MCRRFTRRISDRSTGHAQLFGAASAIKKPLAQNRTRGLSKSPLASRTALMSAVEQIQCIVGQTVIQTAGAHVLG
ncbi:hypothetical protein JM93_00812 [Roseibium hamelinense]|uniref:Uncharacterized protein n=1 Tax=Roseibium hamelinense TaxID=150831 RepID=A0A562THX3_9HYPH|nr:hypothetical protein JM93_00812 [Roseibium hamelinense]